MWFLPFSIIVVTLLVAIPISKYIAWIMDGKYRPLAFFRGSKAASIPGR
jgi:K+-transporting ATPase ATPase A chain